MAASSPGVLLVSIGNVDGAILDYLALMVRDALAVPAKVGARPLTPDFAYDPLRRQHHSTALLGALGPLAEEPGGRVLGVTDLDLFIPILTFVFGEAQLGGPAAVMSLARLRQEFYGLPEDSALLYRRAEKEALHELGHTYDLIHCSDYGCTMHFSNSIEEVDLKGDRFCLRCADGVRAAARKDRR